MHRGRSGRQLLVGRSCFADFTGFQAKRLLAYGGHRRWNSSQSTIRIVPGSAGMKLPSSRFKLVKNPVFVVRQFSNKVDLRETSSRDQPETGFRNDDEFF